MSEKNAKKHELKTLFKNLFINRFKNNSVPKCRSQNKNKNKF